MKYANAIIFIRERLWQKAINFSCASWHFNIPVCITCFSQMIIFSVFHLHWQSIIFFSFVSCYLFYIFKSVMASDWNFTQEKKIVSEIQVVYLMGKIIARQMKQSMTHSNQKEWLETQVSREVRLFAPTFAAINRCTCSFTHLVTLCPGWSDVWSQPDVPKDLIHSATLSTNGVSLVCCKRDPLPSVRNSTYINAKMFRYLTSWESKRAHY